MKVFVWLGAITFTVVLLFFALFGTSTQVLHERLTLTVDTPSGPRSASGITTVTRGEAYGFVYQQLKGMTGGATGSTMAVGTAIMLEVTPGRWLFVTRSDPWGTHDYTGMSQGTIFDPASPRSPRGTPPETIASYLRRSPPGTEIFPKRYRWPAFVTFDDLSNPKSIRIVDPDNLAASFGPGVSLRSLTLSAAQLPGDPAPLRQLLPWLCQVQALPTASEEAEWSDLDRRLFALRQPANFSGYYCGSR